MKCAEWDKLTTEQKDIIVKLAASDLCFLDEGNKICILRKTIGKQEQGEKLQIADLEVLEALGVVQPTSVGWELTEDGVKLLRYCSV
ncbi:MAG: hypothetical protein C4575_15000 [Desulforudis sp.]|nr:MAG: hypothetical protein C4575_15000 [Desulforudis sp.]